MSLEMLKAECEERCLRFVPFSFKPLKESPIEFIRNRCGIPEKEIFKITYQCKFSVRAEFTLINNKQIFNCNI